MYRKPYVALLCALLAALLCLGACGRREARVTGSDAATAVDLSAAEKLGEGAHRFIFTVTFADGSVKAYDVATDETTVGAALSSLGLVEGEQGDYGLYVKTIDGVRADYTLDGAYWAFYVDGAYAMTGVDDTAIAENGVYAFVYTPADQYN